VSSGRQNPFHPTLGRSVRLFRLFLREQSEPAVFYSALAQDSARQLGSYVDLRGKIVLDVGGGPGYFARAFQDCGAQYIGVDLDEPTDMPPEAFAIRASGEALPLRSHSIDVAYSSNVVEHLRRPWVMTDELVRVVKPGGTIFVSFTPWLSPWGGHETAPFHYVSGRYARRRYIRRNGREPKNRYGETLFGYRVSDALRWANAQPDADLVAAIPRYHPSWSWWLTRVPVVREFVLWNLVLVLRRR